VTKSYFDPCESPWNGGCTEPAIIGGTLCQYHEREEVEQREKQDEYSRQVMERDMWDMILRDLDDKEEQEALEAC
jgi:hypothetical protein